MSLRLLDAGHRNPYVPRAMNLLLLLSALLSALTGVSAGVRAPTVPQAISASGQIAGQTTVAPRALSLRPVAATATPADVARPDLTAALALPAIEPLFAARRRE